MSEQPKKMKIHTYPDPVLRAKAKPITDINGDIKALTDNMLHTMYGAPGIGLAANQVGSLDRVIVFDLKPKDKGNREPYILINPEIVEREGEVKSEEACLSVIDYSAEVRRSAEVLVRGVDINGKPVEIEADDLLAICLQHEIDHLNGVLFIDHISSLKRALYKKRLKKILNRE
ncbi:MAG: peptide deformylase [Deltaproteobacteria bacterium]|nr:peptide deformylase [Deltaproteobacteria bacterium]MBW1930605.1 peptide deformylase [Deltaproteobacteria bacterium]MBW2025724.1 peptide deformylase [Deltaproteobacteria bacterium]MBW2124265.1 peptide deformylase [Deltaproteobacteria bacterium]RLB16981.1 MAG: peptide deformylase [Deltaproteobacteria bacterium]